MARPTKAIIPTAGRATRRLPITKAVEKSMLPIGNRPIIDYIVQDCIAAGISEIIFVVSEDSTQIQKYYERDHELEAYLEQKGKAGMIPLVSPPSDVTFRYVTQSTDEKYGTAIPVAIASEYLEPGESVVVLMGDDVIYDADGGNDVARLIDAAGDDAAMLGVEVPLEEVSTYGVIELDVNNNFVRIVEKPPVSEAPSNLINVSKYVFTPELIDYTAAYAATERSSEYHITDPVNSYINDGHSVTVVPASGQYLDGGTAEGWLRANNIVAETLK